MGLKHLVVDKLRVLHVILRVNETNGQYNEHVLPLLDERDITVCSYFEPEVVPPIDLDLRAGDGTLRTFLRNLRRATSEEHDVIHVHAPQSGAIVVLALAAWLRLPRLRRSLIYTVQDAWYDYSRRNQLLMAIALAGFKRIIFCSRSAYESMPGLLRALVRDRWDVARNAADIARVDRALENGHVSRDADNFTVVSVGRLEPVKDPSTLLQAFARAGEERSRLVLVGAGSLERDVTTEAETLHLTERVTLTGLIPRDEVFVQCANADVFVSTSHGEGLPVAVIEAMAAGCPVVLSDIPPHRELADGADFIPLVPTGDVTGFAEEIERMSQLSETDRLDLSSRSREHVLSRFTLPIMHEAVDAAYHRLPGLAKPTG